MVSALPLEPVKHSRINVAVGWRASYAAGGGGGGFGGLGGGGFGGLGGSMGNPFHSFDHVVRSCRPIMSSARMEVEAMFVLRRLGQSDFTIAHSARRRALTRGVVSSRQDRYPGRSKG
jgi:hypothetical protein